MRAVSGLGQERSGLASGVKNVSLELLHFSSSTECWTPNDFFLFLLFLSFLFFPLPFPLPLSVSLFLSLFRPPSGGDRQRFLGLTRVKRFQLDHTVRTPLHLCTLCPLSDPPDPNPDPILRIHECIFKSIYDFHQITFHYRDHHG